MSSLDQTKMTSVHMIRRTKLKPSYYLTLFNFSYVCEDIKRTPKPRGWPLLASRQNLKFDCGPPFTKAVNAIEKPNLKFDHPPQGNPVIGWLIVNKGWGSVMEINRFLSLKYGPACHK